MLILLGLVLLFTAMQAQTVNKKEIYNPLANAEKDLDSVIHKAKQEKKNVFVQIGGSWCSWCLKFQQVVDADKEIDSISKNNYVVYHLNYSNENKNLALLKRFEFPQRFAFPVIVILDNKGKRLHTQNTTYLEDRGNYNRNHMLMFFKHWTPVALNADSYKR